MTDSKTPIPPGAAGTTSPIIQAKLKEEINSPIEIKDSIENALIQHRKPMKRKSIKIISTNSPLYG